MEGKSKKANFQDGGSRFQGKSITNSTVSPHISSNSKCRTGKCSSIKKTLVFNRDVKKSSRCSSSWKDKSLLSKLAKVDFKPGDILSVVKGYRIPFIKIYFQQKIPNFTRMNKKQIALVNLELKEMLRKGAVKRTQPAQREFLSNLFLVGKKDRGFRPVINLKMLNQFIPFLHFKMEDLSQLKHIIQEGDWMCKLDLKDAYFTVPLDQDSRKFVRFQWKENPYEFMCLYFGLGPAPSVFTKLLKIPISLLRKINIRVIIRYVDFESHNTRSSHESRHSHISPAAFRLFNKYKKINFKPISGNRTFGNGDRFNQNDFAIDTREGTKSYQDLSEPSQESLYNSSRIGLYRSPIIHYINGGT